MSSLRPSLFALLALFGLVGTAEADTAIRITDLNAGGDDSLDGLDAAVLDGALYFVAEDAAGEALFRYDGLNPPAAVPDTVPVRPKELVVWQNRLYFQGGPSGDRELWVYDPAGPTLAEALDLRPSGNGVPQRLAALPGLLCFAAFSDSFGFEVHCWDGTNSPAVLDLVAGTGGSAPYDLTAWNGALAFVDQSGGDDLVYTWDGSGAAEPVAPAPGDPYSGACCLAAVGSDLYFQAQDGDELYRLFRHTAAGSPARVSATFEPGGFIGSYRGRMIIDGEDPTLGVDEPELWRRVAGLLRRVRPGEVVAATEGHTEVAGASYFTGYPSFGSDDRDLYKYCGAGPVAVASAAFAGAEAAVVGAKAIGFQGKVYVSATDGMFGAELWQITPDHVFCDDFETGDTASWP